MKKLIILLFAASFFLFSCSAGDAELLAYQSSGAEIGGTLSTASGSVRLEISLFPLTEEELSSCIRSAELRFICSSGTHTATVSNGTVTVSANELSIPYSEFASQSYLRLASLFAVDISSLYSVESDDDGTRLSFGNQNGDAVIITLNPITSLPRKIELKESGIVYEIDYYRLHIDG